MTTQNTIAELEQQIAELKAYKAERERVIAKGLAAQIKGRVGCRCEGCEVHNPRAKPKASVSDATVESTSKGTNVMLPEHAKAVIALVTCELVLAGKTQSDAGRVLSVAMSDLQPDKVKFGSTCGSVLRGSKGWNSLTGFTGNVVSLSLIHI